MEEDLINQILSPDSLLVVLKFLPFPTRVLCERVCRSWREAALACNAVSQTSLCIFSRRFDVDKYTAIQQFCLDPNHQISFADDCVFAFEEEDQLPVYEILTKCPNLRALHIKCYEEESFFMEGIENIKAVCPKIEHLSLVDDTRGCYVYQNAMSLVKNCTDLKHLQLKFPAEGSLGFLLENIILSKSLVLHHPTLDILSTNLAMNIENCSLLANSCQLEKLCLEGTSVTLEGLAIICTSPAQHLTSLKVIIDCDEQLNLITDTLVHLKNFHCIIGNDRVSNIRAIGFMADLSSLFLSVWTKDSLDSDVIAIMKGCRKLQTLEINGEVTDTSLAHLSTYCPDVKRLEVAMNSDHKKLSDVTIERGLSRLRNLKHVAFHHCNVSDHGLRILLNSNLTLNYIRVSFAQNLTLAIIPECEEFSARKPDEAVRVILPEKLLPLFGMNRVGKQIGNPNLFLNFL